MAICKLTIGNLFEFSYMSNSSNLHSNNDVDNGEGQQNTSKNKTNLKERSCLINILDLRYNSPHNTC